ncbi:C3 and PZP-like alpha-2-macroglobulin domain-containing protein 8 [Patiria miniata]|uniref:Farnesoic acid O-methyl transferase domain-containing protein n=1 Tax=Patiria miniata TaxID=46514 RepID=A0A913Z4Z9_PATMI|nr:C3 and PZP-like alpha-2-macroglobulin domain-containing protein 8 [Patiria miniata]
MPFRLDFAVKIERDAAISLSENTTHGSIFAEMNIGGSVNGRAVMRPCYYVECPGVDATHDEAGLVDANEYRPFWIDYKGGVVRVGKGGQEVAFLEWDAGAHHQGVVTQVRIGIASWASANGDWVFYKFCE